jgi:hypothetical protein
MNAAAGVQPITVSYTLSSAGWYAFAALVDAYTAAPTVYGQSTDFTASMGTPQPWPGQRCRTGTAFPLGGWRATGVATGAIPATCPALTDVNTVVSGFVRLA